MVISDNLASANDISVGDSVRVSGTEEVFTVRGIVSVAEESSVTNFLNAFLALPISIWPTPKSLSMMSSLPTALARSSLAGVSDEQLAAYSAEIEAMLPGVQTTVIADFLERYEVISQYLGDFVVVMGLGALLIGGVGIMNTMLVLVRRRTAEIAAVKTFGLQGRQVAALFFTEGLLLGVLGSLLGMLVGIGLSVIVNQYGSVALRQPLIWQVYPEALVFGFVLGLVVTAIFGVAPVLTAVQVRPSIILRPNENHLVTLGIVQSVALLVFVIISLGLVTGHIVRPSFELTAERLAERAESPESSDEFARARSFRGEQAEPTADELPSPYIVGVAGVSAVFVIFAVMIGALWLVVFGIGKLPTLGVVTARLALRNLSTNRLRTAVTLLALSAGMMALSSIAFVGEGTRELLNLQLSRSFGGNVLVFAFPGLPQSLVANGINNALADVPVDYRTTIESYEAELRAINGEPPSDPSPLEFTAWDSDKPDIYNGQPGMRSGRMLTQDDRGAPLLVLPAEIADQLGIQVGDRVTLDLVGDRELEVVGITASADGFGFGGESGLIPPDVLPASASPSFTLYSFQIPGEFLNEALAELSALIFALAVDVQFIDGLIGRLIDQFAAIPTIVGILSLFAAAVIMANTVALSTLERRRQIGILKAIGLKSRRVLTVMFIESSLIGLLSAAIGIGLSAAVITGLGASGGIVIPLPADARLVAAGLLVAAVLIGWTATFLSARVALKERVMNVLRYD